MIEVLIAKNNARLTATQFDLLSKYLPQEMIKSAMKYVRWQDAQAYLLGKFLLAKGLKEYGFETEILCELKYTQFDRPYLSAEIDFNISHSGSYVACVISKVSRVGIDIEEIRSVDMQYFVDQFTKEELCCIEQADDMYKEFFKYWTIKEAVIKAEGSGLNIPIKNIVIDYHAIIEGKKWFFYKIDIADNYMAHVATDASIEGEIRMTNVALTADLNFYP